MHFVAGTNLIDHFQDNYYQLWTATRPSINAQSALHESKAWSSPATQAKPQAQAIAHSQKWFSSPCPRVKTFVCACGCVAHGLTGTHTQMETKEVLFFLRWPYACGYDCVLHALACLAFALMFASLVRTRLNNNATRDERPFDKYYHITNRLHINKVQDNRLFMLKWLVREVLLK